MKKSEIFAMETIEKLKENRNWKDAWETAEESDKKEIIDYYVKQYELLIEPELKNATDELKDMIEKLNKK